MWRRISSPSGGRSSAPKVRLASAAHAVCCASSAPIDQIAALLWHTACNPPTTPLQLSPRQRSPRQRQKPSRTAAARQLQRGAQAPVKRVQAPGLQQQQQQQQVAEAAGRVQW